MQPTKKNRRRKAFGTITQLAPGVWKTRIPTGRKTASGLTELFEKLTDCKVRLVSIKDGLDLGTAAGRLIANVLASVAAYENEVRSERIIAGQSAAQAAGKRWGGSKPGRRVKVTKEQIRAIKRLHREDVHTSVMLSRCTLAVVRFERGETDKAAAAIPAILTAQEITYHGDHLEIADTLALRGRIHMERGEEDAARADFTRALEIRARRLPENHWLIEHTKSLLD